MTWVVAIIFLIITIVLFSGKGTFLIAGYNTSSKAEKAQYDEKKLSLVMGSGMGVITLFLIVKALFGNAPPNWMAALFTIVIFTVVIIMVILCNTFCKAKNVESLEISIESNKANDKAVKGTLIFVSAIFVIVGVMLFTGQIKTTIEGDSIKIAGSYWANYNLEIDSIKSISCVENFEVGRRTNGLGSAKLLEGNFSNDEFGDYILYAYLNCHKYIVFNTDDKTVVLNAKTPKETEDLYKTLESAINQ